jgi:hypothetical protein
MKHVLQKTGIGVGLMATSLGAMAAGASLGLHDFGDSMVFARASGGQPVYVSFVPSGSQGTDNVILLELTQGSGTAPGTWQYYLSSTNLGNAANAPGMKYSFEAASNSQSAWAVTASVTSGAATQTYYGPIGGGSQGAGSTNSASVSTSNGEINQNFSYTTVVSSQTCAINFNAYVGTDDYMQYQIMGFNTANSASYWNTIMGASSVLATTTGSYTITTKSGGAATDTVSGTNFGGDFGGDRFQTGTSYALIPTFSYAIVDVTAGAPASSFSATLTGTGATGAGIFKTMNVCSSVVNSRLSLNSLGLVVGGKNGMLRIW